MEDLQPTAALSETISSKKRHLLRRVKKCIIVRPTVHFHTLIHMCVFTILLPFLGDLPDEVRKKLTKKLIDQDFQEDLEEFKALNWCRVLKPLYPLRVMGDGNCLLHAVSMAMWGIHDCGTLLRRLVYTALVEDEETGKLKTRWRREKGRLNDDAPQLALRLDSQEWQSDWERIVCAAEDTKKSSNLLHYECLEEIHIFVLANVLKRPIIVVADSVIRTLTGSVMDYNKVGGVYLPIFWPAAECVKSPIVLGYNQGHFVPLVGMEDFPYYERISSSFEYGVPLVMSDMSPVPIHFLLDSEERDATTLLQTYLHITEVTKTVSDSVQIILIAKLDYSKIDEEYNIMPHYVDLLKASILESSEDRYNDRILLSDPSLSRDEFRPLLYDTPELRLNDLGRTAQGPPPPPAAENNVSVHIPSSVHSVTSEKTSSGMTPSRPTGPVDNLFTESLHDIPVTGAVDPLVEPSAPRLSLLSNRSGPTNSLVCPSGGPYTSAVGDMCTVPGCTYHASRHTFPRCREHAETTPGLPRAPPTNVVTRLRGELNGSRSLENYEVGGRHLCSREDCLLWGPASCRDLCHAHFTEQQQQQQQQQQGSISNAQGIERQRNSSGTSLRRTQSERRSSTPRCLQSGCFNRGSPEFAGCCGTCYINQGEAVATYRRQVPCRTNSCKFTGTVANGGFCSMCALAECERDDLVNGVLVESAVYDDDEEPQLNTMQILGQMPRSAQEELENRTSFSHCKAVRCSQPGLANLLGYCPSCHAKLLRKKDRVGRSGHSLGSQHRNSAPLVSIAGGERQQPWYRQPLDVISGPTEPTSYQEELEAVPVCWMPGCDRPGQDSYNRLCMQCYAEAIMTKQSGSPRPAAKLYPAKQLGTIVAAKPCLNAQCDRYGDPNLHGYCSKCRPQSQPSRQPIAPPSTSLAMPPGEEYVSAIRDIEKATKRGHRSCKMPDCRNYGNSRCAGYCNDCFLVSHRFDMLER